MNLLEVLERQANPTRYGGTAVDPPQGTDFNVKPAEGGESFLVQFDW